MTEVNRAYSSGDEECLRTIYKEQEQNSEPYSTDSVGTQLVLLIRKIAQAEERLEQIESEFATLQISDLNKLYVQVINAKTQGRDLLLEMAADAERNISSQRKVLAEFTATKLGKP